MLSASARGRGETLAVWSRRETHARGRLVQRRVSAPQGLGLRNKRVRRFCWQKPGRGQLRLRGFMIGGDGREGGPQMLYPGARGASLPVDGRDPCMAAPFPRARSPPPAGGSCSRSRSCRTPQPQTSASLSSSQLSDGGRPVLFESPFAGTQEAEVCDPTPRTALPRASAPSLTGSQPARWDCGRPGELAGRPRCWGPGLRWGCTEAQFRLRRQWTAVFPGPAPGLHPGRRGPFWVLLAAHTSEPRGNTRDQRQKQSSVSLRKTDFMPQCAARSALQ